MSVTTHPLTVGRTVLGPGLLKLIFVLGLGLK